MTRPVLAHRPARALRRELVLMLGSALFVAVTVVAVLVVVMVR